MLRYFTSKIFHIETRSQFHYSHTLFSTPHLRYKNPSSPNWKGKTPFLLPSSRSPWPWRTPATTAGRWCPRARAPMLWRRRGRGRGRAIRSGRWSTRATSARRGGTPPRRRPPGSATLPGASSATKAPGSPRHPPPRSPSPAPPSPPRSPSSPSPSATLSSSVPNPPPFTPSLFILASSVFVV